MTQRLYIIEVWDRGEWRVAKKGVMSRGSADAYLRGVADNGYRARLLNGSQQYLRAAGTDRPANSCEHCPANGSGCIVCTPRSA